MARARSSASAAGPPLSVDIQFVVHRSRRGAFSIAPAPQHRHMPKLLDTAHLNSIARQLAMHADALHSQASGLSASADHAHWQSLAAARFRGRAQEIVAEMRRTARRVESAGFVLAGHARRVRGAEAELAAAGHAAVGVARLVSHAAAELGGDALRWLRPGRP
jgi:hypothetical protein